MRLTKLGHVFLAVHDISRAKDFYTRVLGFEILEEDPNHGGVFMTLGDGTHIVDLVPLPSSQPPRIPETIQDVEPRLGVGHVAFQVASADELRRAYFELIDNQVRVFAAVDHESQESIYFCDPDGNMLEIYWERPNAREIFLRGRQDVDRVIQFSRGQTS